MEDLNHDERILFRKRVVSMILATDMQSHKQHLDAFNNQIIRLGITKEQNNGHLLLEGDDEVKNYNSKQQLFEMVIHSCDFSSLTRNFETVRKTTFALFEEFFNQGDMEKE